MLETTCLQCQPKQHVSPCMPYPAAPAQFTNTSQLILICFGFLFAITEKYFTMNRKQCKEALDIYKKFVVRMDGVSKFLKTAEVKDHPSWRKIPTASSVHLHFFSRPHVQRCLLCSLILLCQ